MQELISDLMCSECSPGFVAPLPPDPVLHRVCGRYCEWCYPGNRCVRQFAHLGSCMCGVCIEHGYSQPQPASQTRQFRQLIDYDCASCVEVDANSLAQTSCHSSQEEGSTICVEPPGLDTVCRDEHQHVTFELGHQQHEQHGEQQHEQKQTQISPWAAVMLARVPFKLGLRQAFRAARNRRLKSEVAPK